jgi:DNA-cytosine methyltransferase
MFSPPCQAFSLAGKRKGEDDDRGVLFYNSHEFIAKNKPRYFIFENVKGLLSDDGGKTFQRWIDFLGGKSVNGNPVIFPLEEATPYHVYYQVLNAKNYGIPQNRERIFIIGVRDDADNDFSFPKPFHLVKRLKDVLENEVDEKYFLSDKMISGFLSKTNGFEKVFKPKNKESILGNCITTRPTDNVSCNYIEVQKVGFINQDTQASQVISENGIMPNVCAGTHGYALGYVETKTGAIRGRNPQNPLSRVSGLPTEQMHEINENGTSNALTTVQKDNVVVYYFTNDFGEGKPKEYTDTAPALRSSRSGLAVNSNQVVIHSNTAKGYDTAEEEEEEDSINFSVPNSETRRGRIGKGVSQTLDTQCNQGIATRQLTKQQLEKLENLSVDENIAGCITEAIGRMGSSDEYMSSVKRNAMITQRIRRLTPRECFRLMDFPETFKWDVSDSQAYKQAGNSICVGVLSQIISKLNL